MRFASLQNSGNGAKYAQAGKAVADSSARVFDTQRKTGPDYAGISKTAMKTAAEEKIAGMKAEASVAKAGINAVADMKQAQIKTEVFKRGEEIKNKQRKAGGIAAIGKIAGAGFLAATDNTKGRERPKGDYRGLYESWKTKHAAIKDRHRSESDAIGDYKPGTFEAPDNTVGSGSGKASGGGNIKPSETGQAYMKMLTSSGMSKEQAAAMVGHLKVESDNFQADTEYAPNAYGTKGRGHLQWTDLGTSGGRRTNFESFASKNNLSPTSFEANSQFLLSELQGNHGNHWTNGASYNDFLQTSNINEASTYLQNNYIRPSKQYAHTDRRLQGAQSAYDAFQ